MSKTLETQLHARIESFASDITAILQRAVADSVAEALAVRIKTKTALATKAGGAGRGRARADFSQDALLREVKRKGGRRMEEISAALRTPTRALKGPMKKLIAEKKVKTTGQARGTKYHAA